jgi:hypothetical protein
MKAVNIDYGRIIANAQTGIRRSAVFMGLGVNAADDIESKKYQLVDETRIQLLPNEVSSEVLNAWKTEFRSWVVAGGFRELVEHLCIFLDRIYDVSKLIQKTHNLKDKKRFERAGLDEKIKLLDTQLGIHYVHGDALGSFYPLRNCLIHRLGVVSTKDILNTGTLDFYYLRMKLVFTAESGGVIDLPDSEPFSSDEDGTIGLNFHIQKLSFRRGEKIDLSPRILTEILFFSDLCVREYAKQAIEFARANGVIMK